jgi:hypothetical protein
VSSLWVPSRVHDRGHLKVKARSSRRHRSARGYETVPVACASAATARDAAESPWPWSPKS